MHAENITSPFTLVIFGASGDLAHLMLFPGLYELAEQKRLPADFHVIGFSRTHKSDEEFRREFTDSVKKKYGQETDEAVVAELARHVSYFTGDYADEADFLRLREKMDELAETDLKPVSTKNRALQTLVAYFSVPPSAFKPIITNLAATRRSEAEDIRLVLEKPFGSDLRSAEDLIYFTLSHFREESLFLLDHYLGKSAVRSLVNLRRHNRILDLLMDGEQIDNIQITAVEQDGIKNRIGYFDQVGTIKDFVQSHLLQLIAITAMDLPVSESAASFQREKNSILSALCFEPREENAVIGQYESYRQADAKVKDSTTETFVALKLGIDREHWFNVPIYLRTGKGLDAKRTYIVVEFKKLAFQNADDPPNRLIIELYPHECVSLTMFNDHHRSLYSFVKGGGDEPERSEGEETEDFDDKSLPASPYSPGSSPGQALLQKGEDASLALSSSLACTGDDCLPPHALFLLDVFLNRRMFFLSFPEVVAAWKLTERILSFAHSDAVKLERYEDGSTGPAPAQTIIEQDGRKWFEG